MASQRSDQDRLWEELRDIRDDVKAIRSKTDKLEARAGMVGAIVSVFVSAGAQVLLFLKGGS